MRAALLAGALLLGCSGEKDDATTVDSGPPVVTDTGGLALCVDAPVVTWSSFGDGFMTQNCQSCHRSTSTDRRGAPDDIIFDTHEDVLDQTDRILARAAGTEPSMPPSGGVHEDDRYLLEVWLTCWE